MRFLRTWEAQQQVIPDDWAAIDMVRRELWMAILVACATPGIPLDDAGMLSQLQYIWFTQKKGLLPTYHRLVA